MSGEPKGALYAQCVKELTLQDIIDLVCLKATLVGADVRVKVSYPRTPAPTRVSPKKKRG